MRAASTSPVSARAASQRMIAEHFGVAVRGALLLPAVDLTDRGVQIDHQRPRLPGPAPSPHARAKVARPHSVELAGVTEREGPQERPHRGRRHRLEPQHRAGAARAQHPDVINMGGTGEHRGDHGEDLWARVRRAGAHPPLDQPQQALAGPSGVPRHDQARVGHEGPHDRRSLRTGPDCAMMQSQKVPPVFETNVASDTTIVADQEAFLVDAPHSNPPPHRWIQA